MIIIRYRYKSSPPLFSLEFDNLLRELGRGLWTRPTPTAKKLS